MPGHSYKGSAVSSPNIAVVFDPFATPAGSGNVSWTWSGTNPTTWKLYQSATQFGTFTQRNQTGPGSIRLISGDAGQWGYVVGVNGSNVEITPHSNTVHIT